MKKIRNDLQKGFTLIEVLIVIGILGILLAIVLVAVNPQENFQQANNTQRRADVNAIISAISQYVTQNNGQLPSGIDATVRTITGDGGVADVDLCADLVPTYIADLPFDPTSGTESPAGSICTDVGASYNTGYTVASSAGNRVTVSAPSAELSEVITVTR